MGLRSITQRNAIQSSGHQSRPVLFHRTKTGTGHLNQQERIDTVQETNSTATQSSSKSLANLTSVASVSSADKNGHTRNDIKAEDAREGGLALALYRQRLRNNRKVYQSQRRRRRRHQRRMAQRRRPGPRLAGNTIRFAKHANM